MKLCILAYKTFVINHTEKLKQD